MKKWMKVAFVGLLTLAISPATWASVSLVEKRQDLPSDCKYVGTFEADAGWGKQWNGPKIALGKAQKMAFDAGANYGVILELNRGITDLNGYCLLEAYHCSTQN